MQKTLEWPTITSEKWIGGVKVTIETPQPRRMWSVRMFLLGDEPGYQNTLRTYTALGINDEGSHAIACVINYEFNITPDIIRWDDAGNAMWWEHPRTGQRFNFICYEVPLSVEDTYPDYDKVMNALYTNDFEKE